jgi:hypothetical protein
MHVFICITCSNVVGKLALMALNLWMIVNWQVCARVISWLTLRKSPYIYVYDVTEQDKEMSLRR